MDASPFAVGQSPFRAKGVTYRNFVAYLEERLRGGRAVFLAGLRDDALRTFASQSFLAGGWYDVLPMVALLHEAASTLLRPPLELGRDVGRFSLQRDAGGIYKLLLRLSSPESLCERAANAARQYFDFVTSSSERVEPRYFVMRHAGVPSYAATMYQAIVEGFLQAGLELAGAKDVSQRWDPPVPMGTSHGAPIVELRRHIRWR